MKKSYADIKNILSNFNDMGNTQEMLNLKQNIKP